MERENGRFSRIRCAGLLCVAFMTACASGPTAPSGSDGPAPPGALRALFIGNSLTYQNDLPGVVQALADSLDVERPFWFRAAVAPNYSLEDHWLTGSSHDALQRDTFDVVIMQQGPSSLPENQLHLREWAIRWADLIRDVNAVPALYMVWPDATRRSAFEAVSDAYTDAAVAVDGMLFPVGRAWLEAWAIDSGLALYGPDAFHPSGLGTYLAALVMVDRLYTVDLAAAPPRVRTTGGVTITVPSAMHAALVEAAREANDRWGR
jgi:hypothetical protein